MADFRFTASDYTKLCHAIEEDDLNQFISIVDAVSDENKSRFGPTTFCPPPSTNLQSPLVTAAWHDRKKLFERLVKEFPNVIDINANCLVMCFDGMRVCTPLVAACADKMDFLDMFDLSFVKYLVENGADVNQATLDGETPLMAAIPINSSKERLGLFKYLVSKGADVNRTNHHGDNCFGGAIGMYGKSIIKHLHKAGIKFNLEHCNAQGYTILHEAYKSIAEERLRSILGYKSRTHRMCTEYIKNVSECVPLPLYAPSTDSTHPGYIPCPLYLAAADSIGGSDLTKLFGKNCPLECKVDSYLLCGAVKFSRETTNKLVSGSLPARSLLSEGLHMLEKYNIKLSYLPPRPEYNNQVEIKTKQELDAIWDADDCMNIAFQCALIAERCLGSRNLLYAHVLLGLGTRLICDKHFAEGERLWDLGIQASMSYGNQHPLHSRSGYCYSPNVTYKHFYEIELFSHGAMCMVKHDHTPSFVLFMPYVLHISINRFNIRREILDLFRLWRFCNTDETEFLTLFKSFIDKYPPCHYASTILHQALVALNKPSHATQFAITGHESEQEEFIKAVLKAGGNKLVNVASHNGELPLTIVADNESLVKLLIDHGAHVDAVNSQGKPALPTGTFGAPSLYCTVANAIVQYSLPYQSIGLPPHVAQFVMLHDPLCQ